MNKKIIPMIIAIVLIAIVAVVGVGTGLFEHGIFDTGNKEVVDKYKIFGLTDKAGKHLGDEVCAIILEDQILQDHALNENGAVYLPMSIVQVLNDRFFWDAEETMYYATPDGMIEIKANKSSYKIDGDKKDAGYTIVNKKDDKVYINIEFVAQYSKMEYIVYGEPNRIIIYNEFPQGMKSEEKKNQIRYYGSSTQTVAYAVKEAVIREGEAKSERIVKKCDSEEELIVIDKSNKWINVKTADGFVGYIKQDELENEQEKIFDHEYTEDVYASQKREHKISMGWHQVTNVTANGTLAQMTASVKEMNVISPTWFSVVDTEGNISSLASQEYVNSARNMGMEVWALIDDFATDEDGKKYIRQLLPYKSKRKVLINNIMKQLEQYNIDGINIDFEYINEESGPAYVQFLRELSMECRKSKKVLSVDNYVASAWTAHYNRREQSVFCDYIVIMGYDEHTKGSEVAGSVASLPFVEAGIAETGLETLDYSKVINAIPFYTRVWFHGTDGSLTSQAVGMDVAEESVATSDGNINWSEDHGQNYSEYTMEDGTVCEVWLEDEKSIKKKLDLMEQYNLGGAAYWKLGFEKDSIWDTIEKYFK